MNRRFYFCVPTIMLSARQMKLTDLPLPILGRIAATVYDAEQCTVASFPFQVVYDVGSPWEFLEDFQSMRKTCRILRDAAHLSIGGIIIDCREAKLIDTEATAPGEELKSEEEKKRTITLKTLLSLPCLRELVVRESFECPDASVPDAIAKALESIAGLKRLQLRGDVVGERWHLSTFPSSTTIEELELEALDERFAKRLLSFQYDCSPSLVCRKLVMRPSIPNGILSSLRSFSLSECYSTELAKIYLESLASAPRLEALSLEATGSEALAELWQVVRFDVASTLNLHEVEFWEKRLDSNWSTNFAKMFQSGCFPCLRKFGLPRYAPTFSISLRHITPALAAACGRSLQEVHIETEYRMREDDESALRALGSHYAFELHLTIGNEGILPDAILNQYSLASIASLSCLTTLTVSDRGVCEIQELSNSPNLKELSFSDCRLSAVELSKLKNNLGTIKKFVLENCTTSAST